MADNIRGPAGARGADSEAEGGEMGADAVGIGRGQAAICGQMSDRLADRDDRHDLEHPGHPVLCQHLRMGALHRQERPGKTDSTSLAI